MDVQAPAQVSEPAGTSAAPAATAPLFAPIDAAGLGIFRIAFGAVMLYEMLHYLLDGMVRQLYMEAPFLFTYPGFDWVKPWPGNGMLVHYWVLAGLALLVMVGLFYRVAIALFGLGFTYVFLLDQTYFLNHYYLVCLLCLIMTFIPADRAYSLRRRWRPRSTPAQLPAWGLWALRAQLAIVYFYAGAAKLNPDWLRGEPMRSMAKNTGNALTEGFLPLARNETFAMAGSYAALLVDLLVVPFLLWPRTRLAAFVVATLFHLGNAFVLRLPIGIFPWYMIAATTLFLEPDWPRRAFAWLRGLAGGDGAPRLAATEPPMRPAGPGVRRWVLVLAGVYFTMQLVLPLRQHLYPGDPSWTGQGNDFAWRMMIFSRDARARFYVTSNKQRGPREIEPTDYVSWYQSRIMLLRPDMLLQFCHHVADALRRKGEGDVQVRAHIRATFNGRRPQLYVDPTVDLASEPRGPGVKTWIRPNQVPFDEHMPVDPQQDQRSPWATFPEGTWIRVRETLGTAGKKATLVRKRTLEMHGGERWLVTENVRPVLGEDTRLPVMLGATPELLDMRVAESEPAILLIGDREVACDAVSYVMLDPTDLMLGRMVVWRARDVEVPYRQVPDLKPYLLKRVAMTPDVVKMRYVFIDQITKREGVFEVEVEDLDAEVEIDGRQVPCVKERASIVRRGAFEGKSTAHVMRWLSAEVPGHIARATVEVENAKRTTEWEYLVDAFGVDP